MGLFSAAMPIGDFFLFWLPLYHELKLGFAIFLWYPGRRGLVVYFVLMGHPNGHTLIVRARWLLQPLFLLHTRP